MNKTLKGILAGCGVLALLGGGLAVLKLTEPAEEESSAEDSTLVIPLWDVKSNAISKIKVENPHGDSYVANRRFDETPSTDLDGNATVEKIANYFLEGYEDLPMNTTQIRLLATRCPSMSSLDVVEVVPDDLAKYGLDDPIRVTLSVDGQDDIKFLIGDVSPVSSSTYMMMDGEDAVYTVMSTSVEPYRDGIRDYLGKEVKPAQEEGDNTIIESLRVERQNLDYDLFFEYDPYYAEHTNGGSLAVHVMEEPIHCLLSPDKASATTHGLYGLTASEVCTPHPSEADLKKAGLDGEDPFVRVTMKTDDHKTTEFLLGKTYETEDGETRYYGMLSGVDCIYGFAPDDITYDDVKAEDISSKNIVDMYIWDIGRLIYQGGGVTLDFEGQGTSQEDFVLKLNGQPDENVERYRQLYTYLLETKAEDLILEEVEPEGEPLAEIHIDRQDNARSYDVRFYDAGGLKAYIEFNGEVRFRCRKSYVTTLIENLKLYSDTEKDFIMSW